MESIGCEDEGNWSLSEDLIDVNVGIDEGNEGSTCVEDNQYGGINVRKYLPKINNIRKLAKSSYLDDNSLSKLDVPMKNPPSLPKQITGKKEG